MLSIFHGRSALRTLNRNLRYFRFFSYLFALKIVPPPGVPLGHVPFAVIFTSSEGKVLLYELMLFLVITLRFLN
jgi:hypothetical protein